MKTREQLDAEYQESIAKLEAEERVRATVAPLNPRMVHNSKLYGSVGSLAFGDSFDRNDDKVSLAQLRDLLTALPPLPTVKAKGTFTRFITEKFADSDANKEKDRETLELIFPVTLKTNSVCGFSLKAEWFTEINGEVWSIDAYLENPYSLAQVSARRIEFKGGFRYENASLQVSKSLNPPDGYWQQVRWAQGSNEYINDFTAYHGQFDDDPIEWVGRAIAATEREMEPAI